MKHLTQLTIAAAIAPALWLAASSSTWAADKPVGEPSSASAAHGSSASDANMLKLASSSGCLTCHGVEAGRKGPDGLPPIGPAWSEVAKKYKGDATAQARLTKTVLTGSNPYQSHWKGKASGLAMPPNAVAISEADASKLVGWILGMAK